MLITFSTVFCLAFCWHFVSCVLSFCEAGRAGPHRRLPIFTHTHFLSATSSRLDARLVMITSLNSRNFAHGHCPRHWWRRARACNRMEACAFIRSCCRACGKREWRHSQCLLQNSKSAAARRRGRRRDCRVRRARRLAGRGRARGSARKRPGRCVARGGHCRVWP